MASRLPILLITILAGWLTSAGAPLTIEECVEKAEANYPLIKKYDLIDSTAEVELSDINKSWLPRISAYAQATAQNVVPSYPSALVGVLQQMGQEVKGLSKVQYKVGADINQTIWDGGTSKSRRELSHAQQQVEEAALAVDLYAVRQRVQNLFFALLLTESQIEQSTLTRRLLEANAERLQSMWRNGTAMKADVDMVEAQMLTIGQAITTAETAAASYRAMLALYIGEPTEDIQLVKPAPLMPGSKESHRPELTLFDKRRAANEYSLRLSDTSIIPKIGAFAQAYYGYPGLDYFHSMMSSNLTFNVIGGIKLSWNIDALYTRRNSSALTAYRNAEIDADRETFLFNSNIQSKAKEEEIAGIRRVMSDDDRIVNLRADVRKAAESQLQNGIIDTTTLLTKITDEEAARLTAAYHEIQLLQAIYELKNLLNQ